MMRRIIWPWPTLALVLGGLLSNSRHVSIRVISMFSESEMQTKVYELLLSAQMNNAVISPRQ